MNEAVQIGDDGWLFLKGGTNNAEVFYTDRAALSEETLKKWVSLLDSRDKKCSKLNIKYVHFLAPDKTTVYPEFYKAPLPYFSSHPIQAFDAWLRDRKYWINVLPHLLAAKKNVPIFYKTDSHWNFDGCYSAYEFICVKLGAKPNADILKRPRSRAEIVMDLGIKLSPPVRETAEFSSILRDAKRVFANGLVTFNESADAKTYGAALYNSIVTFKNASPSAEPARVLLFGDSFCEFRAHMMTGMLAETFEELTFVWNHSVDFDFVAEYKPDILITENVERFVNRIPVDGLDLVRAVHDRLAQIEIKKMGTGSRR